jgi:hypothetical protein
MGFLLAFSGGDAGSPDCVGVSYQARDACMKLFLRAAALGALSELQRQLEHRPSKAYAGEKLLRRFVSFSRRQHDLRQTSRLHILERSLEQSPAHTVPPTLGIDDDVVQHAGGPAQRHIVVRLHRNIGVTDYSAAVLGHKNGGIRRVELRGKKLRVAVPGSRRRREESTGIELVVRRDEQRSEPAEVRKVGARRAANHGLRVRIVIDGCLRHMPI